MKGWFECGTDWDTVGTVASDGCRGVALSITVFTGNVYKVKEIKRIKKTYNGEGLSLICDDKVLAIKKWNEGGKK